MDVGAAEFPEMLPRLEELVLGCDFVGEAGVLYGGRSLPPSLNYERGELYCSHMTFIYAC